MGHNSGKWQPFLADFFSWKISMAYFEPHLIEISLKLAAIWSTKIFSLFSANQTLTISPRSLNLITSHGGPMMIDCFQGKTFSEKVYRLPEVFQNVTKMSLFGWNFFLNPARQNARYESAFKFRAILGFLVGIPAGKKIYTE